MSYTIENVNSCTKKLIFKFENVDLKNQIELALKEKQKDANLKGFRKGKAPLAMVQKLFGPQVENDAIQNFVRDEFYNAIEKEEIKLVGYPSFDNMSYTDKKNIAFDATVEVFPSIELKDLSELKFTQEKVEVSEEEVQAQLDQLLKSKASLEPVKEGSKIKKNDHVTLNFQGEMQDGSKPENMKGEEFVLEIGSGQFIPGFEDGLIGWDLGQKDSINLTFPEDYHAEELKGAQVIFHVEILEIKEQKLPEFTDELAKEVKFESKEDFLTKTKERLFQQKERASLEKLHQSILDELIAKNDFDVPQAMIEQQKDYLIKDMATRLKQQGFTDSMLKEYNEKWQEDYSEKALFQVKSGLILENLASKYKIESTEQDLEKKIKESAEMAGAKLEEVQKYYSENPQIKSNMMYAIREEKTFTELKKEIQITVE